MPVSHENLLMVGIVWQKAKFVGLSFVSVEGLVSCLWNSVAFSNIFMNKVGTEILCQSLFKPFVWKRYIDEIVSLWTTNRDRIEHFIEQANNHQPTIKFTAEISDKETTFLDTYIYKGERLDWDTILDVRTHFTVKPGQAFPSLTN